MINEPPRLTSAIVRGSLWALYLIPLMWIVLAAFKSNASILEAPNSLIFEPTLDVFKDTLIDVQGPILTSAQISIGTTVLVIVLGVPASYALARRISPTWTRIIGAVLVLLLTLQMVPQPMTIIPLYSVLAGWGLLDTLGGLVLADAALLIPFSVLLLRPFVLAIPKSIEEAAYLDGASRFQAFRHVTVPMLADGIITVAVIVFILAWGEFIYAISLFTSQERLPVSALLAQQTSIYGTDWNHLMALAVLTALPIAVVYAWAHKRIVGGLTMGSVR